MMMFQQVKQRLAMSPWKLILSLIPSLSSFLSPSLPPSPRLLPTPSTSSPPDSFTELNPKAIPSLVILGVAKGGTTDLWDLLHTYHTGFQVHTKQHQQHQQHPSHENSHSDKKMMIHPWKELDFFTSHHRTNVCYPTAPHEKRNCSIEKMKILLNCPTGVFESSIHNQDIAHIEKNCLNEINRRQIIPSLFTATASPSLLYSAASASQVLMQFYQTTHVAPLFLLLLRNPIDWIISMFNHGMV
jgi:hypothetical protein